MRFSKEKELFELLDIVYPYAKDLETLTAVICAIHDEDIEEFTNYIKNKKINDYHDILEYAIDFRNFKKYENDDIEEDIV